MFSEKRNLQRKTEKMNTAEITKEGRKKDIRDIIEEAGYTVAQDGMVNIEGKDWGKMADCTTFAIFSSCYLHIYRGKGIVSTQYEQAMIEFCSKVAVNFRDMRPEMAIQIPLSSPEVSISLKCEF